MTIDTLKAESEAIAAEGWKWIEVAPDFAYGHTFGLRQVRGKLRITGKTTPEIWNALLAA